jgi:UDP-N-acetylmuramate dehydrogenase
MSIEISENYSLRPYNTFGIDVQARFFTRAYSHSDLNEAIAFAKSKNLEILVLGGGSNVLFTQDQNKVVVLNRLMGKQVEQEDENNYFVGVGAGENWHEFVQTAIHNNWAGIENLSLIPGCVGAGPMQNIGAYGVELSDVLHSVEALNIHTNENHVFSLNECELGYRESIFKRKEKGNWIITKVNFELLKRPRFKVEYGAIQNELEKMNVDILSIEAVSQAVCQIRSSKLPDPKVLGNAGSFFKNPTITIAQYDQLKQIDEHVPFYPVSDLEVKVPAGYLIEKCGWKGKQIGSCGVHHLQALVLVNHGNAKGIELKNLSEEIIQSVHEKYAIKLEREVNLY